MADSTGVVGVQVPGRRTEYALLAAHPFDAVSYHFGMLLGEEDFQAEQAYHRGKLRLHDAWLHRSGVVWGLEVSAPVDAAGGLRGEIAVDPGFALDAAGSELHLSARVCLDAGEWYQKRRDLEEVDPENEEALEDGRRAVTLDAFVIARSYACLQRPVPAITEPCEGTGSDTAYSRTHETIELLLLPEAPREDPTPLPYRRLRILLGLEAPRPESDEEPHDDALVARIRDEVLTAPAAERRERALAAFRRCAALDVMELRPGAGEERPSALFPLDGRPPLLLGVVRDLRLVGRPAERKWAMQSVGDVDNTVRRSLVATAAIQELLCGMLLATGVGAAGGGVPDIGIPGGELPPVPSPPGGAAGPRVDPGTVRLREQTISFAVTGPIFKNSLTSASVSVRSFDRTRGWITHQLTDIDYKDNRVSLLLDDPPGGELLRLVVRGTGEAPVLGTNRVPLAGGTGSPPGSPHQGNDFVFMLPTRSWP